MLPSPIGGVEVRAVCLKNCTLAGRHSRRGQLNDPLLRCVADQTGDIVDIELVHDLLPMFLDRFNA